MITLTPASEPKLPVYHADFINSGRYLCGWSERTVRTYTTGLATLASTPLTKAGLVVWVVAQRERRLTCGGINMYARTINSCLSWLDEEGHLSERLELPGIEYSRGYIQAWWGKGNAIPERSAQCILKVADQILRAGTEQTVGSEGGGVMPRLNGQRVAVYARVSTFAQDPENQLQELRRYVEARGWTAVEYVDRGVSGAKDKRPALDVLLKDAKRRRFDVLVCWRLDRLPRLIIGT